MKLSRKIYRIFILPLIANCRSLTLPGFRGISLYHVIRFVIKELKKHDLIVRANSVAFSFFLSIFPTIIFIFTLIPLFPIRFDFLEAMNTLGRKALPSEAFNYLMEIVNSLVSIKRGGLLSLGFVLALIFSSSGMITLMAGFDKSYDRTFKKRTFIKRRFIAMSLTIIISFIFLLSFILIVFGDQLFTNIFSRFHIESATSVFVQVFRWLIIVGLIYTSISLIYRYGPSMYRKFEFSNPGAFLATTLSIVSSLVFAYFVNNFGQYNKIYGSIGALIVLLLWLQINAVILLIGFELNTSIAVERDNQDYKTKQKALS